MTAKTRELIESDCISLYLIVRFFFPEQVSVLPITSNVFKHSNCSASCCTRLFPNPKIYSIPPTQGKYLSLSDLFIHWLKETILPQISCNIIGRVAELTSL